ncbi:stage III sporulation protein SpoIIIAB [Cohnella terricola]|uniref:Stage III sporulation protein AB n=1 Tax=Cohnella terricola TaxID=1289167 RepID=A0A559JX32_9BACL|nr:stage III sporulation protein SpoIIIAB [Cohnella terricola]TVY04444.1 stage III sporulation protein AB [Cohnella terricola]
MLKLVGALLVLIAGTLIGLVQSARYAARPRQIRELLHALQRLETEIGYGQTHLPEALKRISDTAPPPLSLLFSDISRSLSKESAGSGETVRECWERIILARWPETAMKNTEREAILRLGATLGGSGREDQLKHIRLAAIQLQAEEAAAREDQRRYEKLSRSLGMLGAALVVIVMI